MGPDPLPGVEAIEVPGFSYLPGFITADEGATLLRYFGSLQPLWESRYVGDQAQRDGQGSRRLTRPVYWLGAWQFACLGYYAAPHHVDEKCVRAEPLPEVMQTILQRLVPKLGGHQAESERGQVPNTCLINYYGSELFRDSTGRMQPRDYARLRMHHDAEPGPVVMFSIGQPAQLEFVDGDKTHNPELSLWVQDRSVVLFSGPHFKDQLYHQVTRVQHGDTSRMPTVLEGFRLRRVSVSFRFVPEEHIKSLRELSAPAQTQVRGYVEQLATSSPHFRAELAASLP